MNRRIGWIAALLASALCNANAAEPAKASPAVLTESAKPSSAVLVPLQMHATGTYYINAGLQGYDGTFELLFDTGSSYMVINEQLLAALKQAGTAEFSREIRGSMADGSKRVIPVYRVAALKLGEHCWVEDVEAAVFPGATRPILGMSVLQRLAPFTMSAEPAALSLNQCAAAPEEEVASEQPAQAPVIPAAEKLGR